MAQIVKKYALDNKETRFLSFSGTSVPNLDSYIGQALSMTNESTVNINGVLITSWSRWYIPRVEYEDFMGIVIYPDASKFWILGHTKYGYYARQIV